MLTQLQSNVKFYDTWGVSFQTSHKNVHVELQPSLNKKLKIEVET